MATSAELMRTCAPLYPSIALESVANIGLFIFFSYLSVIISAKQQLKTPGWAVGRLMWNSFVEWVCDTHRVLKRWPHMHEMDLGQRFRYCRRLNATICRISAFIALIAITRWFHVNNVNGFRYLGYAITCPLMQAELVLLIAPYVWCYRILVVFTSVITFLMLVTGWAASQYEGEFWQTDFFDVFLELNFHNLTMKGWWLVPSTGILCFLSFVQLPILCLVYRFCGGSKCEGLPKGYPKLLAITSLTWWGFPLWWLLSYEGLGIIRDTRWNSIGFVCLNMISKGGFTLQMMSMVKTWKLGQAPSGLRRSLTLPGFSPQDPSGSAAAIPKLEMPYVESMDTLPPLDNDPAPLARRSDKRVKSVKSMDTLPPLDDDPAPLARRSDKRRPSGQSLQWLVEHLKKWEPQDSAAPAPHVLPPISADQEEADDETSRADDRPRKVITDPGQLDDEQLMRELTKRLATRTATAPAAAVSPNPTPRTTLHQTINHACAAYLLAEDSD